MEPKKTKRADLENERTTYFLLGLVVVFAAFFVVLEWRSEETLSADWEGFSQIYIEEELISYEPVEASVETPPRVEETPTPPARRDFEVVDEMVQFHPETETLTDSLVLAELKEEPPVQETRQEPDTSEPALVAADQMPQFPGGQATLMRFLYSNVYYPEIAVKQRIQGRVWCSFIVNTDGSVSDVRLEEGVYYALDEEAIRVLNTLPDWIPGRVNNKPARVKVYLPVLFKL